MRPKNQKSSDKRQQQVLATIRAKRQEQGLSQEAIAMMMGCATNTYSDIENGKTQLSLAHIFRIADALQIEPYTLFLPLDISQHPILHQILAILCDLYQQKVGEQGSAHIIELIQAIQHNLYGSKKL